MLIRSFVVVLLLTLTSSHGINAQHTLWDGLKPGPHKVGYRLIRVIDPTRSFPGANGRPIEFRVWYPAAPSATAQRMPYARYLESRPDSGATRTATSDELIERTRRAHHFVIQRYSGGADTTGLHARLLRTPTAAYANAPPAPGVFPVILYGGGANQALDENTVLWEMLASRGYVVAAVPTVGVRSTPISVDAGGLEAEARDMEYALGVLRRFAFADVTRMATMGFSWGGAAALVVGMRQLDADAVVTLDASTVAARFHATIRQSPNSEDANLTIPLLHLHATQVGNDLTLIEELRYSMREMVEITGLDHIDFNSYMLMIGALRGAAAARDSALNAKRAAFRGMAGLILSFLDQHVQSKTTYITGVWDGYPRDRVRVTRRPAMPVPITSDQLLTLIRTRGIEAGEAAYEDVRRRDPRAPVLAENTLNELGYTFLNNREAQAAERVFLWNVRAYPASANTFDSLADAYIALTNVPCAVAAYRKVLERLPADKQLTADAKESYQKRAADYIANARTVGACPVALP